MISINVFCSVLKTKLKLQLLRTGKIKSERRKMKFLLVITVIATLCVAAMCQRGSYAGRRPIDGSNKGAFPDESGLSSRFGDINQLPVDARGDYALVNRISKMPIAQQPFWYLNQQAIEAHRSQPAITGSVFAQQGHFMGRRRRR